MAKTGTAKSNVQFIHTPGGDDLAVLPRNEYDRLVALAAEAQEDAAASRIVAIPRALSRKAAKSFCRKPLPIASQTATTRCASSANGAT